MLVLFCVLCCVVWLLCCVVCVLSALICFVLLVCFCCVGLFRLFVSASVCDLFCVCLCVVFDVCLFCVC